MCLACSSLMNVRVAIAEVAERMAQIKHKILVLSGKGGVGKSTFAAQLTWRLSELGNEVQPHTDCGVAVLLDHAF